MKTLTLSADGRLYCNHWSKPASVAEPGRYIAKDVTEVAEQYLFEPLQIAEDATLRSIFELVRCSKGLQLVFSRQSAEKISFEGLSAQIAGDGGVDPRDIEQVCVYRSAERNSSSKELDSLSAAFHGVGHVQDSDLYEQDSLICRAGSRTYYSFIFTSPQRLRDLPLRLDTEFVISESDYSLPQAWERKEKLQCNEFTLGEVLHAVFEELTCSEGAGEPLDSVGD